MLKSWHSWLAQYKYGHPSAVALFEFICWIAVMWFLWQPSDSPNWQKTMAPLSMAAAQGPALQKNPNTLWPCESISVGMWLANNTWRWVCVRTLHRSWLLSSLPAWLQRGPTWELISLSSLLKHKQFLTTVTRGRGSTFILSLHLAGCAYALFQKTVLGTLVARDKVQFVQCEEGCGGRWPGGRYWGSSLGIFFLLIFAVCCNLVPPKGNNFLYSLHLINSKEKLLLCWDDREEELQYPTTAKKTSWLSLQIQGRIFQEGKEEASSLASYGKKKYQHPSLNWREKIRNAVEAVYQELMGPIPPSDARPRFSYCSGAF